jgi:hypothetical protein
LAADPFEPVGKPWVAADDDEERAHLPRSREAGHGARR